MKSIQRARYFDVMTGFVEGELFMNIPNTLMRGIALK